MKNKKPLISPYCYPGIKRSALPANFNQKQLIGMTPNDILEIISKESGVTMEDILSRSRKTEKVISRHIFCGILRKNYNYSLPFIGELVGRDHTTVIYATEQFNNRYRLEDNFKNLVDRINYHIELKS
jgi:chromosomal replication initiation ATPase DnaA